MGNQQLQSKTASGVGWRMLERLLAQGVSLVVSLILARLLAPEDYGVIAILVVFITIANIFICDGFSAALIQKKNTDALDYTSVIAGGLVISMGLYALCFLAAPALARFYESPILCPTLRVLALRLPLAAVNSVQVAYLSKKMMFKKFFLATLGGTLISAVVGIYMAIGGFGAWALVAQNLSNYTIDTLILALAIHKWPKWRVSLGRMRSLFSFGYKILLTNLLFSAVDQLRALAIGKLYTGEQLAFYSKGKHFPELIATNISLPVATVLFPAMSSLQGNRDDVKDFLRGSTRTLSYLLSPLLLGFAAVSQSFVLLVLTEKWLGIVPFIFLGCIYYLLPPLHSVSEEAVKAVGRSDLTLKYGFLKRGVSIATLLCTMWLGPIAIMWGLIASAVLATCINAYRNKRLFAYGYREQLLDLLPNFLPAALMCAIVCAVGQLLSGLHPLALLPIQLATGLLAFPLLSALLRNSTFRMLLQSVKEKLQARKKGMSPDNP